MNDFTHVQLKKILKLLAVLTIKKHKPGVVAITGSVGKTSTKEAVLAVLRNFRNVRATSGNFNNEFGLPLTILGGWDYVGGKWFWARVIFASCFRLIFSRKYPEVLVLEYAADHPGDIKYLLSIAKPQIAVITAVGDIPVHVEYYNGPEEVAKEKARLVEALPKNGVAVLNKDDKDVIEMRDETHAHVTTYGFDDGSVVRISNFEPRFTKNRPAGISFKLEYGGSFVPVRMDGVLGKSHAYAAAAGAAVGLSFGINLVRVAESLLYYNPPPSRMKLLKGKKGTQLIDDAYNASPESMKSALATIKSFKNVRRVGILGDMLEIGKYTVMAHEAAGKSAAKSVDLLVTVGPRARLIAEEAHKHGLPKKKIFALENVDDVLKIIDKTIQRGDVILLKASRRVGMDKLADYLKAGR